MDKFLWKPIESPPETSLFDLKNYFADNPRLVMTSGDPAAQVCDLLSLTHFRITWKLMKAAADCSPSRRNRSKREPTVLNVNDSTRLTALKRTPMWPKSRIDEAELNGFDGFRLPFLVFFRLRRPIHFHASVYMLNFNQPFAFFIVSPTTQMHRWHSCNLVTLRWWNRKEERRPCAPPPLS